MKKFCLIPILLMLFFISSLAQTPKIESVYTDLTKDNCRYFEPKESDAEFYLRECEGIGGYKLEVAVGSASQTLNIILPNSEKRELDLFENVPFVFSRLGEKAEWRFYREGEEIKPIALIVRFEISEDRGNPQKITPYLGVIKIMSGSACITDIVEPAKNQNVRARQIADNPADRRCLATEKIRTLINKLANENEFVSMAAADALIKIGPGVIAPLIESLKQKRYCDFQFSAAQVIRKIDKKQEIVKSILFDVAGGKCEYRYSPEKYLPDANQGSIISKFFAASILAEEIEGGIDPVTELLKDEDPGEFPALFMPSRGLQN